MKSVLATFRGRDARYSYLVPEGDDPQVGDLLLTSVITGANVKYAIENDHEFGFKMAIVVEVEPVVNEKATKFYIQRVPRGLAALRREQSTAYNKRRTERRAILAKLERLDRQVSDEARYARIAEINPEAAELLSKLREMGS